MSNQQGLETNEFFPNSPPLLGRGSNKGKGGGGVELLKSTLTWILFHLSETWRVIVSCILSLIIYILYSLPLVPGFIVCILVAVLLSLFGQYEVNVSKRRKVD
jgi:hypothetical protein